MHLLITQLFQTHKHMRMLDSLLDTVVSLPVSLACVMPCSIIPLRSKLPTPTSPVGSCNWNAPPQVGVLTRKVGETSQPPTTKPLSVSTIVKAVVFTVY